MKKLPIVTCKASLKSQTFKVLLKSVVLALVIGPLNLSLQGQTAVSYNFNTSGQLAQEFNSTGPGVSSVTESQTAGLANSGAITVSGGTNAVFSTKNAYSMGPVGSSYTFTSYVSSVGPDGYAGMGFTAASPASAGSTGGVYRPSDGVGISVHGGGFIFHNGATDYSANWDAASGNGLTAITQSTSCSDLLQNTSITCGSPDRWYKIVFKLIRAGSTTFNMRVEVWPVDRLSGQDRYANATAIYEVNNFTNSALASAPQIFSYFNFSGDRVRVFDNYGVNLAGGASVIAAGYPVVLTSSATLNGSAITVAGNVTSENGGTVTERGFVYGTSSNPTTANSKIVVGSGIGTFSGVTPSLSGGTYYLRAFATNATGTSYGSEEARTICVSPTVSFKLSAPNVTTSAIQGQTGSRTENFNSGSVDVTIPISGSFAMGSYVATNSSNVQLKANNEWGGSGSQYLGLYSDGLLNITLTDPSRYVGFWWGAGDALNTVTIYGDCGGTEVQLGQFNTQTVLNLLNGSTVVAVDGNTYQSSAYKRNSFGFGTFWPYAYINLELSDPDIYFTRIVVGGGNFEIDNITTSTVYGAATFTVPSAPTGLTATRSGTSATINFTPGSNGGTPITNYQYSLDNGQTWITVSPATATSPITISGLTAGQGYDVQIRAVNAIGTGAASSSVTLPATSISAPAPLTFVRNVSNANAGSFEISGFAPTDNLYLTISLRNPPVGTTLNFSSTTGLTAAPGYVLSVGSGFTSISVTGTEANLNAALSSLKLSTGSEVGAIVIDASVTLNPSGYFYSPSNGHWYRPMTWPNNVIGGNSAYDQIKALATGQSFKGQNGYLVTITNQVEQNFIQANVPGDNILIALTDKDQEGVWKWDAGPEAGTIIRSGNANVSGQYNVWCTGEPNDHGTGEDFAVTKWSGGNCWNDYGPPASSFPAAISGYVIEFGTLASSDNQNWTGVYQASVQHTSGGITVNSSSLTSFTGCTAAPSSSQSISVSGTNLQGPITVTAPTGYQVSLSQSSGFGASVSISQSGGSVSQTSVFVRLSATSLGSHSGSISIASSNTVIQTVAISGSVAQSTNLNITNSLCGNNQSLLWAAWNSVNTTSGQGTFGNLGVTVSLTHSVGGLFTTQGMYAHNVFPSQYNVPNSTTTLANSLAGTFTFCFSQPVTNPQIAFSSIGNGGQSVSVTSSVPYQIVWSGQSVVYNSSTVFTGTEGYNIVSFPGTHECITLVYGQNESYANLAFGFENFNCAAPTICAGQSVTLTASGSSAYLWSPSTGLSATNTPSVVASPLITTTYTVVDPANPCSTKSITITVPNPVAPSASSTQYFCPNETLQDLVATPISGQSVRWYASATGGSALPSSTALISGTTYYAGAVDVTCGQSPTRTAVLAMITPSKAQTSSGSASMVKGTPAVVDNQMVIYELNPIDGALVFISTGFASGDILDYPLALPSGVTKSYNVSSGVLTFTGTIQPADLQTIMRGVTINTTSNNGLDRVVTFNVGSALPFSGTNHFYRFVTAPAISWTNAKDAAALLTYNGLQGYLATITSSAENQFIASRLAGQGWMGASDAAVEGQWRWVTGPESGQQFWQGIGTGTAVGGLYNNWASGEPNDAGGEDYAHFLTNGQWNDYPHQLNNISGYVVEFGGLSGEPCVILSSTKTVNVTLTTPPTVTTTSPIGATTGGTAVISGQVVSDGGAAISERGFVIGLATTPTTTPTTGGFKITDAAATTGQFTGTFSGLQPNTVYYARAYAINAMGTAYGSEVVFTTPPAVPATITTNRNDATFGGSIICSGTSVTLSSSVAVGTLEWFSGSCGGTSVGTGASVTVSPTVTTTYFVRSFNATTGLRSACQSVIVTVQASAPTITYSSPYYLYYSSEAITPNSVTVSGSGAQSYVASYAITPALPAGLVFNTATGQITGTSVNGSPRATYTVTGTTPCGATSTTVEIEVLECSGLNVSDFLLRGNAVTLGSGVSSEFRLTEDVGGQFGAVWNQTRLDLTRDFDIQSQIFLGSIDANGADGIAFVLQPLSTNQGSSGGGLGYAGINPSVAVEFDTYQNSGDITNDHVAFMVNGVTNDHSNGVFDLGNIEDGAYRTARFKWEAASKTFRVFVAGTQVLVKSNWDIVGTILNNNPNVYWGFTGATGGAVNVQKVKFDRYCLTLAANTVANVTTTTPIGTVTSTTAAVSGEVVNDGGSSVTERGFVIGLATAPITTPTTGGFKITDANTGVGTFSGAFTGLQPATLYYARAYAVNGQGTAYGNEISFYTRPADLTGLTSSEFNSVNQANIICFNSSTTLTAAGVSGVVYWYTASCGGTQVGTGNTLTVSPTTTTTYYARNFNNNLFSDGCASITVVVRPQLVAPTIVGAETICWNSQATGLTGTQATGGSSATVTIGFSYQWQYSEDFGGTWQNIVGQNNPASLLPGFLYQTTQYRLLATDLGSPACTTNIASNVIQVTVRDPFTPSVVSTTNPNNTVCQAGSVNLSATPTIGGSGPLFLYQWQRSFDSINWVDEGPALQNTTAYTVATVTTDTYYRLIAFDLGTPACGSVFSTNAVFARVQTAVTQGSISGAQHICAGTAPTAAIASVTVGTGRGLVSYRWEASTDNGQTWSTITGALGASYQPGVLQTTTDYRRFAVSTFNSVACESLQPTSVVRIVVDQVPVAIITAAGTTSCVNAAVSVPGVTINHGTAVWTHNGQGAISGSLTAPVYTPVAADAGNSVTLTLTVTGTAICLNVPAVDTYVIVVDRLPVATAGGSATICENSTHTLVGAASANGTILWTQNGTGSLAGATTLTPTYTAAAGDAGQTVTLTMTVSSTNTCSPATASATYTVIVNQLPAASAGGTQTICSLASATVSGASSARGTILWTHNGSGSISGATTLTPTYTAGAADAGTTVTLTMTVTSTNVCGPQTATATYAVVVRPDFVPATFVNQKQDLCYNTSASQITATAATGGTGPYAYQWQVSTDSTTWSNISAATSLTYTPTGTFTSSRFYRILSTDLGTPTCGTTLAGAADVKLLVRAPLTPPVLAAVTICQGTTTTLTPSLALGGRNNFTYQWQQSANGTSGWSNIGTASASIAFTTPSLTGTSFYRVIARDENVTLNNVIYISCGSTFSQTIRVTVAATTTAGALSGDETTCVGAATAAIASATAGTGSGVVSYRWEQSIDNGTTWTAITGAASATYAPGVLTQTTMYRRFTISTQNGTACESVPTAAITKTVQQLAVFTDAGSNVSTNTDAGLPTAVVNYSVAASAVTPVTLTYTLTGATTAAGSGTGTGTAFGIGTTTATVTATTLCGATSTTFTVVVIDNENPVITAGSDMNVSTTTATTGCAMPVTVTSPVATDNAPGVQVSYVLTGATTGSGTTIIGRSLNVGTTVITWTATDGSGNTATDVQNVVVTDAVLPAIAGTPANITLNATAALCTAPATWTVPTATDECGMLTFTGSRASGDLFPVGVTTVTYTATDIHGNVATSSFTVTVDDNQLPVISGTPANITVTSDANACGTAVAWTAATSADNCAISTFTPNIASGSFFAVGRTRVRYTAVDVNGNTDTAGFWVEVLDLNPVLSNMPANITVSNDAGLCSAVVTWDVPSFSDNCTGTILTSTRTLGQVFAVGTTTVTYTATDNNGNATSASFTVTVNDTELPVWSNVPANITIAARATSCDAVVTWSALTVADNCTAQPVVTSNKASGDVFPLGTTTVTFTGVDVAGNAASASFTVTVVDQTAPVITVPANITESVDANACTSSSVVVVVPAAADQCDPVTATSVRSDNLALTASYPLGVTSITWTSVDLAGNAATPVVQTVTVIDTIAPYATTQLDSLVYVDENSCVYYWENWRSGITAVDNCGDVPVLTSALNQNLFLNKGVHIINFTLSDAIGNQRVYNHRVRVVDTISPKLTNMPANITAYAAANCETVVTWVDPTPSDNCVNFVMSSTYSPGDLFGLGITPVNFIVTDASGQMISGGFTITVLDTAAPVIPIQAATIALNASGQASLTLSQVLTSAGITDNCGLDTTFLSKSAFTCADLGANTVTITATDVNGNTRTRTAVVTVVDNTSPVVVTKAATLYLNASGTATLAAASVNDGTSDNCAVSSYSLSKSTFNCTNVGANTVTLSATDASGNVGTATATVTVLDTLKPVLTVPTAGITAYATAATCAPVVTLTGVSATDNCTGAVVTMSPASATAFSIGATTVTATATDASGNVVTKTFTVTVLDTIKPVIPAQAATIALNASGQASLTLSQVLTSAGITDNCGVLSSSLSKSAFTCADLGANTVTITATDVNGNTRTRTAVVTVVDNTSPVVVTKAATLYLNASGTATLATASVNNGTSDNCAVSSYSLSKSTFNCSNVGANTVTLSATDASGNVGTATATVTVLDTLKPVLTIANDTIVSLVSGNQCSRVVTIPGVASSDNCSSTVTMSPQSGSVFSVGTTPVVVSATDASGNQVTSTIYVIVRDLISPVIAGVPVSVSQVPIAGSCAAVVTWAAPAAFDNCSVVLTSSAISGSTFAVGTHTIVWTAVDPSGNTTTAALTFTVSDTEAPTIANVPSTVTLYSSATQCNAIALWTGITATDNCGSATVTTSIASGSVFTPGTTNVVVVATDAAGNQTSTSFQVIVLDTINPVWNALTSNILVGSCSSAVTYTSPAAVDNCGTVAIVQTSGLPSGSVFPIGVTTNTFVATDASGNSVTTSFTVTVQGSTFNYTPVLTVFCLNDAPLNLMPTGGGSNLSFSGSGVSGSIFTPSNAGVGNHQITYNYVDSLGCVTVKSFTVTVNSVPSKPVIARMTSTTLKVVDTYQTYQWRRNGLNIAGANQQVFTVTTSGVYDVVVTNGLCSDVSDPYGFGVTIGEDELELNELRVQPNPNNGQFTLIHSLPIDEVHSVQIVDMLGRVVYEAPLHDVRMSFDVRTIAQGQYLIVVRSASNVITKPIVIQH